jgi:carboxyl-terminal processing protease
VVRPVPRLALALALSLAAACGSHPSASPAPPSMEAQFDALWQDFDLTYPDFAGKGVDWSAARTTYRDRASAAGSEEALVSILLEMLGLLRDQHVALIGPQGDRHPSYTPQVAPNFDLAVDATYLASWGLTSHGNWGEGMIGDVPYVHVKDWSAALAGFDAFLQAHRGAPGMVIDVRGNGGGNNQFALAVAARFADGPRAAGYVQYRNGPGHGDLNAPVAMTVAPGGPWQYSAPTLLLVGPMSLSSTEDFVAAMRVFPTVVVAGAPTGGASANPALRTLGAGWSYTVSRWLFTTPDGIVVEGHGLPVHVPIAAAAADFAIGRDPVLDYAVSWAANPVVVRPP